MKKELGYYIRWYYGVIVMSQAVLPLLFIFSLPLEGEGQLAIIAVLFYAVITALSYLIYFTIPAYQQRWERIGGFVFPPILGLLIFLFFGGLVTAMSVVLAIQFLFVIGFIWHAHSKKVL